MPTNLKTHQRYNKLMVANRGEIAIRILRAASELNLRTMAVYTFEDRYSLHRYKADESYQIGKDDDPLKPYLDIEELIRVAKKNDVDAIHPGYGFLSENVDFARRCREEGIKFVGPTPESMEMLGDKVRAKKLARSVNVPLIEDSREPLTSAAIALKEAAHIGYPVMIKAASGGGGRGMRVVRSEKDLVAEFEEARGESRTAFGDDTVFLERYIENPKHIEVQLLGDEHGNLVHLYERDCSVQRRFQKVVEIAPCLTISEATKQKLYDYSIQIGKAANYSCAGTVEFLVDQAENIFFIEVNPRVQVEHTITEEITGVDIVRSQILISMGYPLSHPTIFIRDQSDVQIHGCAIQCRITTEDPTNGFKPDYGTLVAYRSASGFGIRLDAGSAYPGAVISPYFDSLLVKVTAWGRTMKGAAERLHRALREFRIRGVKTNVDYVLNLLQNETFTNGEATVNFIPSHPELLEMPRRQDSGTKTLNYLAEVIVNGNPDVKFKDARLQKLFRTPIVPDFSENAPLRPGSRDRLKSMGREAFCADLMQDKRIHYTDTTFRDAHQSLLATRMRTYDMLKVAESFGHHHGHELFSMEVWGGATFDVSMRFLKECPWTRLKLLRKAIPNTLFQMLLRGSNAVGYTAYPDNLIVRFVEEAAEAGIDVFRIFDSLNWVEAMKVSIHTVRNRTQSLAEASLCYTGDVLEKGTKYPVSYYVDLAKALEDEGAHILAIKDMAGLLKPRGAEALIGALREAVHMPIHLHTHDTSSVQSNMYMSAVDAGVDVIDMAIASMSGLTSQPNFNAFAAIMEGHEREHPLDLKSLNHFSDYWESVRNYYYPFESELKAGTAEVYEHEIPGGQYSNLRPQARGLGLEDKFDLIKENYVIANDLVGDIVKVTPSSKVVGDLAMFMTANGLTKADILEKGSTLSWPDSVKGMMRGDLGQPVGGFPAAFQKMVLKDEKPYTDRPNQHMEPIDIEGELVTFKETYGDHQTILDYLSYRMYPKVFEQYHEHYVKFGKVRMLPTPAFFFGLEPNEELMIELAPGKTISVKYLNITEPNDLGNRLVFFKLNGQTRAIELKDNNVNSKVAAHRKAKATNEIGSPLQGNLSKVLVKEGDTVDINTPLFIIEAMKMESTITSPLAGKIKEVVLNDKTLVEQDDLIIVIF